MMIIRPLSIHFNWSVKFMGINFKIIRDTIIKIIQFYSLNIPNRQLIISGLNQSASFFDPQWLHFYRQMLFIWQQVAAVKHFPWKIQEKASHSLERGVDLSSCHGLFPNGSPAPAPKLATFPLPNIVNIRNTMAKRILKKWKLIKKLSRPKFQKTIKLLWLPI